MLILCCISFLFHYLCRKQFRAAFGKLDVLCSIFPDVPILALTTTATKDKQQKIIHSIGLQLPVTVEVNPDRANIFFNHDPGCLLKKKE